MMTQFSFFHGLGDCSNAAHLFSLYTSRGIRISVHCEADKAFLFKAAGCDIVNDAGDIHPWEHPPCPDAPSHSNPWAGNKITWGLSQGLLPDIGNEADNWKMLIEAKINLDEFVDSSISRDILGFIATLPRPLVLFAPQGNHITEKKDLSHHFQSDFLRTILERTEGSVLILDWDNRVFKMPHWRVRHLSDDWRLISLMELYVLINAADVVVGCDSGILHFTRFTDCLAIGVWTGHDPSYFTLPRQRTMHIVSASRSRLTRFRRFDFNIIECAEDSNNISGSFVASEAVNLLSNRKRLLDPVADSLLNHLILKTGRHIGELGPFVDRHVTLGLFLTAASKRRTPIIVETGTIRCEEDWSAGYSTYLFGMFLNYHCGGELHSIDNTPANVAFARSWTSRFGRVSIHLADSRQWFSSYGGPAIDLLYLDSADVGSQDYQECCLQEAQLAVKHMASDGIILLDDTCWKAGSFQGKGALTVPWLIANDWKIIAGGYQLMLSKLNLDELGLRGLAPI